jgi:hypothetical protein
MWRRLMFDRGCFGEDADTERSIRTPGSRIWSTGTLCCLHCAGRPRYVWLKKGLYTRRVDADVTSVLMPVACRVRGEGAEAYMHRALY